MELAFCPKACVGVSVSSVCQSSIVRQQKECQNVNVTKGAAVLLQSHPTVQKERSESESVSVSVSVSRNYSNSRNYSVLYCTVLYCTVRYGTPFITKSHAITVLYCTGNYTVTHHILSH